MEIEHMSTLFDSEDLDELVHAAAASFAAGVNNDGPEVQLSYLLKRGMTWDNILAYAAPRFDEMTPCGPDVFPEARLLTEHESEGGVFLLAWHAASMTRVNDAPYAVPADDCEDPRVLHYFAEFNSQPPKARRAVQHPETGQHYIPIWTHENNEERYQNPDQ